MSVSRPARKRPLRLLSRLALSESWSASRWRSGAARTGEMFGSGVNIKALDVPYKGGAPAAADLMGGQIDFMFSNAPEVIGFIRGGRLRPLGVTSPVRLAVLPDVPTVAETV